MKTFSITDVGMVRQVNQDYVYTTDNPLGPLPNLFVVADGMGGHQAGDYASKYTVEVLKRELPKVGKVRLVLGNYSQYSSRYDLVLQGEVPNVFNPQYAGGCLMDINFYNVYLSTALFGKPKSFVYYPNRWGGLADTSGVLVMQYDGFVGSLAGAKDTWGVNYFQIEGEKGHIYIKDGSNGIAEVRVVTKDSEETINLQENPEWRFYEVQKLTEYMLAGDYEAVYGRLDVMIDVVEILEDARKKAGILFPGE